MLIDEIWDRQRVKANEDLELFTMLVVSPETFSKIQEEYKFIFKRRFVNRGVLESYFGLIISIDKMLQDEIKLL